MKKEIKEKWVEALRSGKYRQGQGLLRKEDDSYCCLGVLCDIVSPDKWELKATWVGPRFIFNNEGDALLPKSVGESTGLTTSTSAILYSMNDSGFKTFSDIADWIEANIPSE